MAKTGKSVRKRRQASERTLDALVFIDTNILLDFYRVRGWEGGLSVLDHISANHARLITGSQVEMEFKKNRQRVILDSLGKAKGPDWSGLSVPTFLQDSKPNKALETARKQVDAQVKAMRSRIEKVFSDPARHDPVYRVAQALFRSESALNLARDKDARFNVRRLAMKRFALGYPPRKEGDTSIGDAINWEWIVRCANETGKHVIIVSRDSDYGHSFQKTPVINDWLRQEFCERTSPRRQIVLTDRLTEAFKRISVPVTKEEVEQEEGLIEESHTFTPRLQLASVLEHLLSADEYQVMNFALGLSDGTPRTPEEVAALLSITREEALVRFHSGERKAKFALRKSTDAG
jgi:hypothetical protein